MNQSKINLAIDERLDRIDAFYKKRIDDLSNRVNELEKQERALTKIMEITADEIQELQEAEYVAEQMLIDENNRLNKESK